MEEYLAISKAILKRVVVKKNRTPSTKVTRPEEVSIIVVFRQSDHTTSGFLWYVQDVLKLLTVKCPIPYSDTSFSWVLPVFT